MTACVFLGRGIVQLQDGFWFLLFVKNQKDGYSTSAAFFSGDRWLSVVCYLLELFSNVDTLVCPSKVMETFPVPEPVKVNPK